MSILQTRINNDVPYTNMFVMLTITYFFVIIAFVNRFYLEFGLNVRRQRQRVGVKLSQDALAKRVGLSRTSVTNIEKGRQQLPLHMLYSFADALGVEPASLLPDKKKLIRDGKRVTVDLSKLPPDLADFVGRVASHENR